MDEMGQRHGEIQHSLFRAMLGHLSVFFRLERRILVLVVVYSLVIGLFALVVPLTVQELVNTFSFSIQPIMIATLVIIMVAVLTVVAAFKAFQYYAVEMLQRRIFAWTAIAMTQQLPHLRFQGFNPWFSNRFIEVSFMQRALSVLLVDIVNVVVGGAVGMTILIFYHPYFLLFNILLLIGFAVIFFVLSHGGLHATIETSHAKYDVLEWIQQLSHNLLHLKATDSESFLIQKTDQLIKRYVDCRRARFAVLFRQYIGSLGGQILAHSSALALAGWLLSIDQLTLGQLVAVEVVVGSLLINFDGVVKSVGQIYFFFTALTELDSFFSLPKDTRASKSSSGLVKSVGSGIQVTGKGLTVKQGDVCLIENFDLEVSPGEKIGIHVRMTAAKVALARVLGGLESPSSGTILYDGIDLRDIDVSVINRCRGFMLNSQHSLFQGTIEDNIVLDRPYVSSSDVRWALRFTELENEIDVLPQGLKTNIIALGETLAPTLVLRILLARAIAGRPQVLIFDGLIHDLPRDLRESILRRLCSRDVPWSVIFVSNDPELTPYADRRIALP